MSLSKQKTELKKMNVPFFKASISEEEEQACTNVLRSGWLTTGKETHEFEKEFAQKINSPFAFLALNIAFLPQLHIVFISSIV